MNFRKLYIAAAVLALLLIAAILDGQAPTGPIYNPSAGGIVSSVFTRTGAIAATTGDYTVAQVTGAAPLAAPAFTGGIGVTGAIAGSSDINAGITGAIYWASRTKMLSGADGSLGLTNLAGTVGANVNLGAITTFTNCSSSAAPAVCGAAAAGSVVIAAAGTTVTVNTTAVTANSQIMLMYDASLGTRLSVTCNATEPALYGVTARTPATSFTITASVSVTNPICFSYIIIN